MCVCVCVCVCVLLVSPCSQRIIGEHLSGEHYIYVFGIQKKKKKKKSFGEVKPQYEKTSISIKLLKRKDSRS